MADETTTPTGGGNGAQAGEDASAAPAAKVDPVQPTILIDQGPRDPIKATLTDDRCELTLRYARPLRPQEHQAEEYAVTVPSTLAWRSAWLRAVSLAWSDPALRDQLCANPYSFIHNYCGYAIPKTVNLVVVPDKAAKFVRGEDDTNSWVWYLSQSVLVMYLPPKPEGEDVKDAIVALASYEAVGSAYPFTATC